MESGAGSPGDGHKRGLRYPSWNQRSFHLQGVLMFIIFTAHFQWGASERNDSLVVPGTTGAWNKTLYKTEGRCSNFHDDTLQSLFYYWPEDDPIFDHCCTHRNSDMVPSFTYGKYGPDLGYVEYYDLGLIDQCLPFWRCLHLFKQIYATNLYSISCESTDLTKLFKLRFFRDTLFKRGLLQSALPLILFSEILVMLSIALDRFMRRPRPRVNESRDTVIRAGKTWLRRMRKTALMDWTHLCLLAIIGNGLIEAVGRQDPYLPLSKSFYNYGRLYIVLWILVACSSVLHQITSWIAEMDEAADDSQTTADLSSVAPAEPISSHHASKAEELEKKIGLNDDWKWQPIAAQAGILFSLGGFLTYPSFGTAGETAGAMIGVVVSAACPWSGLYASKVIIQTTVWLIRRVYQNRFSGLRNYRGWWRSVLHLQQSPGRGSAARRGVARPEDSAAILDLVEGTSTAVATSPAIARRITHLQQPTGRGSATRRGVARPEDSAVILDLVEGTPRAAATSPAIAKRMAK